IRTGFKVLFPYGMHGVLVMQSGMAKKGLQVEGGLIDWDYHGEVAVLLSNNGQGDSFLEEGDYTI
ncbi:hypothetical protein WOLCODRAFT_83921, partial [Wolfiporia cocos MD-104 SS10]